MGWFSLIIGQNIIPNNQSINIDYDFHYDQALVKIVFCYICGLGRHNIINLPIITKISKKNLLFFTFTYYKSRYSTFMQFSKFLDLRSRKLKENSTTIPQILDLYPWHKLYAWLDCRHHIINCKIIFKKSKKGLFWHWKLSNFTLLEDQNLNIYFDFGVHISTFRAKNTRKR